LAEFKQFLGDSVFVAHNVDFDYKFLSKSFKRFGLGEIANRKVCTIELARKTIPSRKYGLSYLNETLHLQNDARHRALGDAKATAKLLGMIIQRLPDKVRTVEDLIEFAKHGKKVYTT
jgi:DNA polymerase-3 subunit epsilon